MKSNENPESIRIEIEQTADIFKWLAEKELIKIQIDEALDEIELLRADPNSDSRIIAKLEELVSNNVELLSTIGDLEQDYRSEIESMAQ